MRRAKKTVETKVDALQVIKKELVIALGKLATLNLDIDPHDPFESLDGKVSLFIQKMGHHTTDKKTSDRNIQSTCQFNKGTKVLIELSTHFKS